MRIIKLIGEMLEIKSDLVERVYKNYEKPEKIHRMLELLNTIKALESSIERTIEVIKKEYKML